MFGSHFFFFFWFGVLECRLEPGRSRFIKMGNGQRSENGEDPVKAS